MKIPKLNKETNLFKPNAIPDYVNAVVTEAKAEIKVTTDAITSTVSQKVGASEIISRINQTAEAIKISASKLDVAGVITAINGDTSTTIDGGKITASSITLGKLASAVQSAVGKASDYLTTVDSTGVLVHPAGDSTTGWRIASAIELLKGGASYLWAGLVSGAAQVRVGLVTAGHVLIKASGMEVFGANGTDSVAEFGATSRVGKSGAAHVGISAANGFEVYDATGTKVFQQVVDANRPCIYMFPYDDEIAGEVIMTSWINSTSVMDPTTQQVVEPMGSTILRFILNGEYFTFHGYHNGAGLLHVPSLQVDNPIPISSGGTGKTGTTTGTVTRTGVTANDGTFEARDNGMGCTIIATGLKLKTALASGSNVTLGTVPSGYRPPKNYLYAPLCTSEASLAGGAMVRVGSAGEVVLYNASGASWGTSTSINFTLTWAA